MAWWGSQDASWPWGDEAGPLHGLANQESTLALWVVGIPGVPPVAEEHQEGAWRRGPFEFSGLFLGKEPTVEVLTQFAKDLPAFRLLVVMAHLVGRFWTAS